VRKKEGKTIENENRGGERERESEAKIVRKKVMDVKK